MFGPAWTVLYTAIGIAGWRLWTRDQRRTVVGLHATQLALNAVWPFTFFAARHRVAALTVIAALDTTIATEIVAAARELDELTLCGCDHSPALRFLFISVGIDGLSSSFLKR